MVLFTACLIRSAGFVPLSDQPLVLRYTAFWLTAGGRALGLFEDELFAPLVLMI